MQQHTATPISECDRCHRDVGPSHLTFQHGDWLCDGCDDPDLWPHCDGCQRTDVSLDSTGVCRDCSADMWWDTRYSEYI